MNRRVKDLVVEWFIMRVRVNTMTLRAVEMMRRIERAWNHFLTEGAIVHHSSTRQMVKLVDEP